MKKIRMGIIGCGGMMKRHIEGIEFVENLEVVAFSDTVIERANDLAKEYPGALVTTDYKTMVDLVDAVLVALPHDLHYECGMYFALNNKHVLMEKPLCNTEEECLKLIETCENQNVVLMCAYPLRYKPSVIKLKEMIDSGEYGKVMQISMWTEQFTKFNDLTQWGATARLGGGQFFSHGCHYVDLLLWFLGNPLYGSHFGTNIGTPWLLKEGTSIASFKFENGALGYHGATWGSRGTHLGWDIQVMTEKGLLELNGRQILYFNKIVNHIPGRGQPTVFDEGSYEVLWEDKLLSRKQTQFEITHFIDCIVNNKKPLTDGHTSLKSLQVIWKMYDAEKQGVIADLTDIKMN